MAAESDDPPDGEERADGKDLVPSGRHPGALETAEEMC